MKKLMSIFIILLVICPSIISIGGNAMYINDSYNTGVKYTVPKAPKYEVPDLSGIQNYFDSISAKTPVGYKDPGAGVDFSTNIMKNYDTSLLNFQNDVRAKNNGVYDSAQFNQYLPDGTLPSVAPQAGYTRPDNSGKIRDIFGQLKQADLTSIRAAYDKAIQGYNGQRPLQDQYKYSALNTNDANYYQGQQGLNAAMEATGQRGGENITGNIALQSTRGNGVNDVNQTYTNNLSAIDQAVRQAQDSQASQESQSGLKWDSQMAQAILNDQQQGEQNAQALAGLTGTYINPTTNTSTPTLELTKYNDQQKTDTETTAKNDFVKTIGQYYDNYQSEIDSLTNDNNTTNDWKLPYLKAARQEKLLAQQAEQKAAIKLQSTNMTAQNKQDYDNALATWKAAGVASKEVAAILGINEGDKTEAFTQSEMTNTIAKQNADTAANKPDTAAARLKWEQENVTKGLNPNGTAIKPPTTNNFTLDDWAKQLDSEFNVKYDSYGSPIPNTGLTDVTTKEQRILNLNLDPTLTKQLYQRYNIPLPQ